MVFEKYVHHEVEVSVRSDLKGKHREHCLCYSCDRYVNGEFVCPIAKKVYKTCKEYNLVSPVWECPSFNSAVAEVKVTESIAVAETAVNSVETK